jgi:hypothetical protein
MIERKPLTVAILVYVSQTTDHLLGIVFVFLSEKHFLLLIY